MSLAALIAAPLAACQPSTGSTVALEKSPAGLEQVPLTITNRDGKTNKFTVEVAATPQEQERGLMFRETLAPDHGMIFPYNPPVNASFWMKNTLIPLDMLFVRADGTVARIEQNAVPMSLDPVPAGEPIGAVLELAGGRTAELGITAGAKVDWPH